MQIFLQSRGTDWPALFCASKPACSCIYRDGRCLTDSGMTQPAPVFFYIFSAAVRLRYSWQVLWSYAGTADDSACISPFSKINYTRLYNNHLPECPRIPFWRFPVSSDIFFKIRKPCSDPAPGAAGSLFGNGSFPVPVNAFLCSRCAPVRYLYCLSDNAVHEQDILDGLLHNDKR